MRYKPELVITSVGSPAGVLGPLHDIGALVFVDVASVRHAERAVQAGADGLVVLRSVGKFFGLAGARVGFVFAPGSVRAALAERLGPWTLAGPARWAARHALADRAWQAQALTALRAAGERLQALLATHGLPACGPALFKLVATPDAARLHAAFARRGILLRLFETPQAVRFGLPSDEAGWARLAAALAACR